MPELDTGSDIVFTFLLGNVLESVKFIFSNLKLIVVAGAEAAFGRVA